MRVTAVAAGDFAFDFGPSHLLVPEFFHCLILLMMILLLGINAVYSYLDSIVHAGFDVRLLSPVSSV